LLRFLGQRPQLNKEIMAQPDQPTDARERLRQNFIHHDLKEHPNRWEHLWAQNDMPWDKGFASPALVDVLADRKPLLPAAPSGRRPRALVPGCGKGYDVLLLASWGYDAVGVEAAATAIKAATAESQGWEEKPDYAVKDEASGRGSARFVFGDFFEKEWEKEALAEDGANEGQWDLIYDYTVSNMTTDYAGIQRLTSCSSCVHCHRRCVRDGLLACRLCWRPLVVSSAWSFPPTSLLPQADLLGR
jgi:SAM-dependent methyltransferase